MIIDDMFYDELDLKNIINLQEEIYKDCKEFYTIQECINIWQNYSWDLQASWLSFPDNKNEIIRQVKSNCYFKSFKESSVIKE